MEKTTTEDVPPPTFDKNEEEYERLAGKEPGHYQFNRKVGLSSRASKQEGEKRADWQYADGFRSTQSQEPSPAPSPPA